MRLAISIDNYGMSQQCRSLCLFINDLCRYKEHVDVTVFYNTISQPDILPACSLMPQNDMHYYGGPVIATNIRTAKQLLWAPCPAKKFLYIWNIDWLYRPFLRYNDVEGAYSLDLIARGPSHAALISKIWKPPKFVADNFDLMEFINEISTK